MLIDYATIVSTGVNPVFPQIGFSSWQFLVSGAVIIIVMNVIMLKWKAKAERGARSFFGAYTTILTIVMAVYAAIYTLLLSEFFIYGAAVPNNLFFSVATALITGGLALIYYQIFRWFKKTGKLNALALSFAVFTILIMAQLPPLILVIFFAGMAVYDYIAVFKLKTMITLANVVLDKKNPLPFLIKEGNITSVDKQKEGQVGC